MLWNVDLSGLVDGGVQGELNALNEVEDDGVFETAVVVSVWGGGGGGGVEREGVEKDGVEKYGGGVDISWKRMLLRSRALLASRRSIAPSMMRIVRREGT